MPTYDYECSDCGKAHEQNHRMFESPAACPMCGGRNVIKTYANPPRVRVPDSGWESENGGRGRYIGQLAAKPDVTDPNAFCRSRTDAVEKARRQGWRNIEKV